MIALFDTNIVLDILLNRDSFFKDSFSSVVAADYNGYEICITSNAVTDIYYISNKLVGRQKANELIEKTIGLFRILEINELDCFNAYEFPKSLDFEDAIVYANAKRNKAYCIITRDNEHFKSDEIKVYTPGSFLESYKKPWK